MALLIAALVLSAFLFQFGEATHVTAGLLKPCGMHCLEVTVWSEVSYWFANGERTFGCGLVRYKQRFPVRAGKPFRARQLIGHSQADQKV